jgi:hypothetical protein
VTQVIITHYTPHCIGWVLAVASLWGNADDHILDEPVRLTEEALVRIRYGDYERRIVADRKLTMKTIRTGTHVAMRFYFKSGKFFETEIDGIWSIGLNAKTIEVNACS